MTTAPPPKPKPSISKASSFFILVFIAAALFRAGEASGLSSNEDADTGSVNATSRPAEIAINVSAFRLFSDYESNEVAADARYKGRALAVSGTVQSVDKDLLDDIIVVLQSPNMFMGVHASLKASESQAAANLTKGERVVVLCQGEGRVIGIANLSDCTLR